MEEEEDGRLGLVLSAVGKMGDVAASLVWGEVEASLVGGEVVASLEGGAERGSITERVYICPKSVNIRGGTPAKFHNVMSL